jgi:hypothetical protein
VKGKEGEALRDVQIFDLRRQSVGCIFVRDFGTAMCFLAAACGIVYFLKQPKDNWREMGGRQFRGKSLGFNKDPKVKKEVLDYSPRARASSGACMVIDLQGRWT